MSTTPRHGTHPDSEVLSALAVRALGEKERGEVLAHLAVCSRCRQVVALAGNAADVEAEMTQRPAATRPKKSWRGWTLALAPVAAVVATAAIAIYVHERNVMRDAEVAQIEQQQTNEKPPAAPLAMPQSPAPAAAPKTAALHGPSEPRKKEKTAEERRAPLVEMTQPVTQPAPPPIPVYGPAATPEAAHDGAQQAAQYDEERKRQAEEKLDRRLLAVTAPTPEDEHSSPGGGGANNAPESTEPPAASTAQLEAPAESSLRLHGLSSLANLSARRNVFHLPSKRPSVSIASRGRRIIAVDDAGNLFLSEDSGETWEKIEPQWSGRTIAVRRHGRDGDTSGSTTAPDSSAVTSGSTPVSGSETLFELVNDQGQVWVSEDGKTWTAK